MRHRKNDKKLGRSSQHKKMMLNSMVSSFLKEKKIKTTLAKAKMASQLAEKMVTAARKGVQAGTSEALVAAHRNAFARLQDKAAVKELFDTVVPKMEGRDGGYTRIMKVARRHSDGSEMAILEWVEAVDAADAGKDDSSSEDAA
jgi:large subunit ribosomal protein L17